MNINDAKDELDRLRTNLKYIHVSREASIDAIMNIATILEYLINEQTIQRSNNQRETKTEEAPTEKRSGG